MAYGNTGTPSSLPDTAPVHRGTLSVAALRPIDGARPVDSGLRRDQGVPVLGGFSQKKKTPEDDLGGKRKAVSFWVCRVKTVGLIVQGTQPVKLGRMGFGGESIRYQPLVGWIKTGTPTDQSLDCRSSGSRRLVQGSRICSTPGTSLHPDRNSRRCVRLFAESDHPSDHVGETIGIPFTSLTIPSVLYPEGLRFPGVRLGWFAH